MIQEKDIFPSKDFSRFLQTHKRIFFDLNFLHWNPGAVKPLRGFLLSLVIDGDGVSARRDRASGKRTHGGASCFFVGRGVDEITRMEVVVGAMRMKGALILEFCRCGCIRIEARFYIKA